jgi:hypothetical protein
MAPLSWSREASDDGELDDTGDVPGLGIGGRVEHRVATSDAPAPPRAGRGSNSGHDRG